MGQEVATVEFSEVDFKNFSAHLKNETDELRTWFAEQRFTSDTRMCGLELEAWLAERNGSPSPRNAEFLETLSHPLVVPELAKFNFELNTAPRTLGQDSRALSTLHKDLEAIWTTCIRQVDAMELQALTIGVMPTLQEGMLNIENMTASKRYEAMNRQLFSGRGQLPLSFHIDEGESIHIEQADMMLEAASTSLQVHLKVGQEESVRCYNASMIASAPLVAAAANSPFLYGRALWEESRIAIFERSVPSGNIRDADGHVISRAGFGTSYANESLFELFEENLSLYPPILPEVQKNNAEPLPNLRLHNGTVWRWNRPVIGFDDGNPARPHLRIEHRTMSASPSLVDAIANTAYYLGLTFGLMSQPTAPEHYLPFEAVRSNFYQAAKYGLAAQIRWTDGNSYNLQAFSQEVLLPIARKGLERLGIIEEDIAYYIDTVLAPRLVSGQTGAAWQKAYVTKHGADMANMVNAYITRQRTGKPVCEWDL